MKDESGPTVEGWKWKIEDVGTKILQLLTILVLQPVSTFATGSIFPVSNFGADCHHALQRYLRANLDDSVKGAFSCK